MWPQFGCKQGNPDGDDGGGVLKRTLADTGSEVVAGNTG